MTMTGWTRAGALALAGMSAALLAACGSSTDAPDAPASQATTTAAAAAGGTLPDALDDADGLQTVAEALKATGLGSVFAGKGSYTLLAPQDDAFDALGDKARALITAQDHAPLAALARAHMLPGAVTPADLRSAIAASKDGTVRMKNLAGGQITFSQEGDTLVAKAEDGSKARLVGQPVTGGQSLAIPVDAVLKTM